MSMYNKTWTLTDEDGNQPTKEEVKLFRGWLTHNSSRPIVNCAETATSTKFRFDETEGRPTFADAAQAAQAHAHEAKELRSFIDAASLAVEAKDWATVAKLFGKE